MTSPRPVRDWLATGLRPARTAAIFRVVRTDQHRRVWEPIDRPRVIRGANRLIVSREQTTRSTRVIGVFAAKTSDFGKRQDGNDIPNCGLQALRNARR